MKQLNDMGVGMHPLNYASKISKIAVDVAFTIAVNDKSSINSRIEQLESSIKALKNCLAGYEL